MTIRKNKNGTYSIDISAKTNPITGKRIRVQRKGIKKYNEALKLEAKIREEINNNKFVEKNNVSISKIWSIYFDEIKENHKQSYINSQESSYRTHILPYFQNINIQNLTKENIKEFREYLLAIKLSPNTANKIILLLKKMFDIAIELNFIKINPAKLKKLTIEKKKMNFWTIEEFNIFLSLIKDEEYSWKVFFLTLYFTGMRLGEILALNWEDLNSFSSELNITKTFSMYKKQPLITTPKTKYSNRRISINNSLLNELQKWKFTQREILESYLLVQSSETQIFQNNHTYITKDKVQKKFISILNRDKNLNKIRLHDFRHSHVALLINNGEDYIVIKERLGHSSITTTIDVYGHLFPNKQKSTADKLDSFFSNW
ncbi:tyrosine-type recombinase/integrase [Listeria immobilis]|uniref:Site-specific integrase n=1 Tax=Listeria immobilis TaxID=2713502 RepID=A0ABR6SVF4_9LIST|nr:site-specific integrase [Listeria immobilis]MBC1509378.1 site-specific integrase [Listeria immobilis]MBC6312087.1 site-specific integrase [Listeria immobilis]